MRIITSDLTCYQVQHILNNYHMSYLSVAPETPRELLATLCLDSGKLGQTVAIYKLLDGFLVVSNIFDTIGNVEDYSFEPCRNYLEAKSVYEQIITESIDYGMWVYSEIEK